MDNNSVTAPRGFLAAGVAAGIKRSGKLDVGLIVCPTGAKAAALFTTNKVVSSAVTVCKEHMKTASVYGVVVNSGNANTCTGKKGLANAGKMCKKAADEIEAEAKSMLVASTGIIGEQLPIEKVLGGIEAAAEKLSASSESGYPPLSER